MISKTVLGVIISFFTFIGLIPIAIQNILYISLWIIGFILVIIIGSYETLKEWSKKLIMKHLTDEEFQNEFFMGFISERKSIQDVTNENIVISKMFEKCDLSDFLKFYLYILIKRSKISFFNSKLIPRDELHEIIENDVNGNKSNEIRYSQIYSLRGNWELGEPIECIEYEGKIKFKILLNLDQEPSHLFQKSILLYFIEKELEGEFVKEILNNLLNEAETRGIIKSVNTESCRTFGNIFYICYRYGENPEKNPFLK